MPTSRVARGIRVGRTTFTVASSFDGERRVAHVVSTWGLEPPSRFAVNHAEGVLTSLTPKRREIVSPGSENPGHPAGPPMRPKSRRVRLSIGKADREAALPQPTASPFIRPYGSRLYPKPLCPSDKSMGYSHAVPTARPSAKRIDRPGDSVEGSPAGGTEPAPCPCRRIGA